MTEVNGEKCLAVAPPCDLSEVTDNSPSWAVPVHVISRDPSLIAPFVARGYAPGMIPGQALAPMETFLVDFLRDFSAGAT